MYVCQAQTFSARLVLLDRVINNLTNYMHVHASGMKNVVLQITHLYYTCTKNSQI